MAPFIPDDPWELVQGLMDIGATVCLPRTPRCEVCPLRSACRGRASGRPAAFGRGQGRQRPKAVDIALVALLQKGSLLLQRRQGLLAGLWGLVTVEGMGTPLAPNGVTFDALRETGIRFTYTFTHRRWRVRTYVGDGWGPGTWVRPDRVGVPIGGPDRRAIDLLMERGDLRGTGKF